MNLARLQILFLVLLILAACGKKGPVRPLEAHLPNAPGSVELVQSGDELLLSWKLPDRNQDGTPLAAPPTIDIYRMLFDPNDSCPECRDRSTLLYSIDPELPEPAQIDGDRYLLRERKVSAGQGYHYRLVPVDRNGQAGEPLVKRIAFLAPPAAPEGLRVTPHDRSTVLDWEPLQPAAGFELVGYHVYRRDTDAGQPLQRLTKRALAESSYNDYNLANGKSYDYQLRALLKKDDRLLESLPTAIVSATPEAEL